MIEIINKLKKYNPLSIFTYGSFATNTQNQNSDVEIGVIFDEENFISNEKLLKIINNPYYSVFSFKKHELETYSIDTPFDKNIYIASLILGNAKTIYGEKIIEKLTPPKLTKQNFLNDTYFNLGYALSAYRIHKAKNIALSNDLLYKSIFYTTRTLVYIKTKQLISGYNNIYKEGKKLKLDKEYNRLLDLAYTLRNDVAKYNQSVDGSKFLKDITYINKYVLEVINNSDI